MSRITIITPSAFTGGNNWLEPVFGGLEYLSFFGYVEMNHPDDIDLFEVVRPHERPRDFKAIEVLVNLLPDPLHRFPALHQWAASIEREALQQGARVVNRTDSLSHGMVKSAMLERWRKEGIPCPRARRVTTRGEMLEFAASCGGPVILKADDAQCLDASALIENLEAAQRFDFENFKKQVQQDELDRGRRFSEQEPPTGAVCAAEFVDVRGKDGLVRKARYMVLGSFHFPRHLFISKNWLVRWPEWDDDSLQQEEDRYLEQTEIKEHELFQRAAGSLGLDAAGIDYSWDAEGRPVFWEANPHYAIIRKNKRPAEVRSIERHHETLLRYWKSLLRTR